MCGIVGYIGKRKALPILIQGIRNLEYRGYDSAGIAVLDGEKMYVERAVGRVANLEAKLPKRSVEGGLGIVHSRWATHGGVTEANAHPHTDCAGNIHLVHNGIIENYKELKEMLAARGHTFASETDTEILAHLIEDFYAKAKQPKTRFEDAVRAALKKVHGTYGLAILSRDNPDKLIAVRNFSPLLLGIGKKEYFIASDASAVMKYTRKVVYLEDGEMAVLTPRGYHISDLENRRRTRRPERLEWSMKKIQKGGFPHFMLKEIFEQPEAIMNSTRGRMVLKTGEVMLGGLREVKDELKTAKRVLLVGCGTAYLAGKAAEGMFEEFVGIPAQSYLASELRYREPVFQKGDVAFFVSQSGETADTLAALRELKRHKIPVFGVVNAVGSTIARETDAGVYQHVGPEIAVASTKAFTSQVTILALIAVMMGRMRGLPPKKAKEVLGAIKALPDELQKVLAQNNAIKKMAKKYLHYDNFLYLGRKYNLPAALEGALKIKEIAYVHAEGMSIGEMKHGRSR